ncbi:nitroreductase [Salinispora tropica]|uniref:Nitroreductase n=1 Tax=Salinispora tropica (strain ATCC BAA-916 / DSM 44818 / JCM 13857 / NBRC 105044 / CNB-440) TaxID=369723 RepID=A4X2G9_SALTO|nr:nitroreductase [Salinispora tropica]ABP53069.1 nitroreductase [Salinispora tropica CNB-440]
MAGLSVATDIVHPLLTPAANTQIFDGSALPWTRVAGLLEAARWTTSRWNRQPWRFLVGRKGDRTFHELHRALTPTNRTTARGAGTLILALRQTRSVEGGPLDGTEYELGLAVARLSVQARATGWRIAQLGGFRRRPLMAAFEVPADFEPFVILAVGRATADISCALPPRPRLPLAEIAFTGRWGTTHRRRAS